MIGTGLEIGCRIAHPPTLTRWQDAPAAFAATTIYDFNAGLQSWAKSSTNGVVAIDTTVKDAGKTQSLKVLTGDGAQHGRRACHRANPEQGPPGRSFGCASPSTSWRGSATRGSAC